MRIERQRMIERKAAERAQSFDEVCLGFDEKTARIEASRCLNCKARPCVDGCPVNVKIPDFIALIKDGKFEEAAQKVLETNNLPAICGRVCPQEAQCEKHCIRNKMEGAVSIGGLERFVADYHLKNKKEKKTEFVPNGKKVAVVGSGPSGLSCAAELAKKGFSVTVFEAFHKAGGVLVYGIPEFRLPKALVQQEIDELKELGVKFDLNSVVGKTYLMEDLLENFDAIYIGSGAGLPSFLGIEGESLVGVFSANEYLTRVNLMKAYLPDSDTPLPRSKKCVVVGGGNVAMDGARTALRMGADTTIVYRRGREEMPARKEEVRHAEEEGISFELLTNPVRVLGENGRVTGLECVRMALGELDESGRRRPEEIKGSNFVIDCDMVIIAVGTSPNPIITSSFPTLQTGRKGTLVVDENGKTSVDNVYAGGDAVTGAATVILAMGAGKTAAKAIIEKLK